jgi:hypothetical protein
MYKKNGRSWNNNAWEKSEDGVWQEWSTYNSDSKWDWYTVGGRWAGLLKLKKGKTGIIDMNHLTPLIPF